jgi:hypothetical protein
MTPGLAQILAGQAPPQTAMSGQTPDVRKNPTHEWYVAMQKLQITAKQALTKADEQDPVVKDFLAAIGQTALRLITIGTMAKPVIAAGLARAFDNFAPQVAGQLDMLAYTLSSQQASQPSAGPGGMGPMPGQPPTGMGNPLAGPPMGGQPPMGGSPAPPGGPPGVTL